MASAKLTLIGMYNWDNTLFNDLTLPTGIDKDLFINSLMLQGGEFEVLYPDPDFLKQSIKVWGNKWFRTFSEWYKGTLAEWNPIHNYDRYEDSQDDELRLYNRNTTADYDDKRSTDMTDKRTADHKEKSTLDNKDTTSQLSVSETEHQVAAYDSNTYQASSKDLIKNGASELAHTGSVENATSGTDTNNTYGTDTVKHKGTLADVTGRDNNTNKHKAHLYGNIGITSSSSMLAEFYSIAEWNLYQHMSDVFISELLIAVY